MSVEPVSDAKPSKIKARRVVPRPPRTCRDFLEHWNPRLRSISGDIEIDFSWEKNAVTITDMRIPSMLRTGILYTAMEVADWLDERPGDFEARVDAFMAKAMRSAR